MRTWADVAWLATAKNLNGGLVVRSASGLPFLLEEGMEVAFVPPVLDMPRRAIVEEIRPQDDTSAVVWFEGVDDIDTAKALCGCHVLVRREELPELAQAIAAAHSDGVSGWEVHDAQAGLLGTLLRVEDNPGQSLLVVDRADGQSPLLIPLVDEFLVGIDEERERIDVDVPAGLLSL
ncbi:MAG: 16S rRNA processing protein RimM [Ellagibacter isourolithinifaciens]|uniref:ribosome maturation factor RimM n=1 Tax=Ellagibacter isourolithinifaciens TaxID=2137581 RepID=UPI002A84E726|nr:16S rRNA processing protein RimM [Ellagibacter isourolithinifaciens]